VEVFNFGLADHTSIETLAKQGVNTTLYRGLDTGVPLHPDRIFGDAVPEKVQMRDIKEFMAEHHVNKVDLAAMNCEGGEYPLLFYITAFDLIDKIDNIMVQFHNFGPHASSQRDIIRNWLSRTHKETFCYPFIWENWSKK